MKYGIYNINLSIGYSGADREDAINISDYFPLEVWESMTQGEQEDFITAEMQEVLGQYIEYSFKLED